MRVAVLPKPRPPVAVLRFHADGRGSGLYTEAIDLQTIGTLQMDRASRIESNGSTQKWEVTDLNGIRLFTHPSRQHCLEWERVFFQTGSRPVGAGRDCETFKPANPLPNELT